MRNPTKAHIICHLLAANGPMTRAALLQAAAAIQGKPYRASSNNSYFQPHRNPNGHGRVAYGAHKSSLVASGLIVPVGKQGNTLVYGLGVPGGAKAAEYRDWLAAQA